MTQHNTIHRGTAVITGASTGMGYDLIIVARDHNRLNQLATHFTTDSGRSVEVVAADLTGFARGERVTIPSLHDETLWNHYEQARQAMMPHLGNDTPAERYLSSLTH
ncbi:putative short-chain dehydrogenase/reductase SDR [Enterobacteriaceae bacterium ATCC 29904]|nr:putative short-chain dehydrogenase/reductase SDR [Enterobacteriaceae bacterium ATCC 29904]